MTTPTSYVNDRAHRYDELRFSTAAGRAINDVEIAQFRRVLGNLDRGASALEVGCGTGRFLQVASAAGLDCEGVDPSADMLELVRKKFEGSERRVRLTLGEGAKLPFADNRFDFVYSIRVMNQMASAEYALAALGEMFRVTRPGGLLLVEFANHHRPRRRHEHDIRLRPQQVVAAGLSHGGKLLSMRGAFLTGMTGFLVAPPPARALLKLADQALSLMMPRLCARCYATFTKLA